MKFTVKTHIALPQDHGSWVFLFSPLLIGLFAADAFSAASIYLIVAATVVFLIRQPLIVLVKSLSGRRSRNDLPQTTFWIALYAALLLLSVALLLQTGNAYVLWLGIPGLPVFAWHLWLVSKRAERRQAGIEILATGVLALSAPAALWVGNGSYDPIGWLLWLLVWLQSAASIVHAYMRLTQRELTEVPPRRDLIHIAQRALSYTSFNVVLSLLLGLTGKTALPVFIPFVVQWAETIWGTFNPAVRAKPTAIGIRQFIVSTIFTVLFILVWRQP